MRKLTQKEIITRFHNIHGDKYDYSEFIYNGYDVQGMIICNTCGYKFPQTPNNHLHGKGCKKCSIRKQIEKQSKTYQQFEKEASEKYNNVYEYYQDYVNAYTPILITCRKCGYTFPKSPHEHLNGGECPNCKTERISKRRRKPFEQFVKEANEVHHNYYDYVNNYVNNKTPIDIICPIHGVFQQPPDEHLHGSGCPKCKSSKMEKEIRHFLSENNIKFEEQKKFSWLCLQSLDFYLNDYDIAIECQGIQHFEIVEHFGGKQGLYEHKERDERKKTLCEEHGIKIIYYANYKHDFPYNVITDKNKLLNEIKRSRKNK